MGREGLHLRESLVVGETEAFGVDRDHRLQVLVRRPDHRVPRPVQHFAEQGGTIQINNLKATITGE
jgi:hypothetical protein